MEPKKIKNPTGMLIMHGTVIAVVLYMAWQLVRSYRAGGAEAPSLTTLIVGLVLLVGGCVVVGWLAVRLFLQAKREEKALEQDEIFQPVDGLNVEVVRRLVEEDDVRLTEQGLCQQDLDLDTAVGVGHTVVVQLHGHTEALQDAAGIGLSTISEPLSGFH